jgi:hypothetical protein
MANDRAVAPRPSRVTDDLTLSGLLDVLDRAEPQPARSGSRSGRAALHRTGVARRPSAVRPVPVPAVRPRPLVPAPAAPVRTAPAPAPAVRRGLRARVRGLVRRLALWGAGPDGAHLAWGRPVAPAPRPDGPVVLTELPNTPTVQPAAPSPAAALRPARVPGRLPAPASRWSPRSPGRCRHRGLPPHRGPRREAARREPPGPPPRPGPGAIRAPLRPVGSHPAGEGPRPPHRSQAHGEPLDGAAPRTDAVPRTAPGTGRRPSDGRSPVVSAPPDRPATAPGCPLRRCSSRRPRRRCSTGTRLDPPPTAPPSAMRGPSREAATAARHGWPATRSVGGTTGPRRYPSPRVSDRHRPGPAPLRAGARPLPARESTAGDDRSQEPVCRRTTPHGSGTVPRTATPSTPADGGRPSGPGRPPSASGVPGPGGSRSSHPAQRLAPEAPGVRQRVISRPGAPAGRCGRSTDVRARTLPRM